MTEKHEIRLIEEEMKESYLDYSMSVIVGRALPDFRDGMKPVHRRILFAMNEMGLTPGKPFRKSARVVGEVLGKYHPHGDQAVYDSMVRMAQTFSLRYPLVRGQGNFGSVDGDNAAAMRYTESKLSKIAAELLQDIEKDTVDFVPNFDNSLEEPSVLPAKLPNLLINGGSGIAVGMATNIPPHNLKEVCKAAKALIDNPDIDIHGLTAHLPGPDFPTGGEIHGDAGIKQAYATGRGKIKVRGKTEIEYDAKGDPKKIIIIEIPFMVNKSLLINDIAESVKQGQITQVSGLNDESDRDGMRLVVTLKKGSNVDVVLNQLFKHTRFQTTFGIIMLGLVKNRPKCLNIKEILEVYVEHRLEIIKRRSQFDYLKAKERQHILEGLLIALRNIDDVVALIKKSKSSVEAQEGLINKYDISEKQAKAILEMKLSRLTALEQDSISSEHGELTKKIEGLKEILDSKEKQLSIIKEELNNLEEKYGDDRRTTITEGDFDSTDIDYEDLIEEHTVVITRSHLGYVKRTPTEEYKSQQRGGKGVTAGKLHEDDFMEDVFITSTHSYLLCFSNNGKLYWLKGYKFPENSRTARGTHIANLLELKEGEVINTIYPVREFDEDHFLIFITKQGKVKKTSLSAYSRPRKGGIIAIGLNEGDEVVGVLLTDGKQNVLAASKLGKAIKFDETEARPMGRSAAGVRGMKLKKDDEVVGAVIADPTKTLITVTENGFGKRTPFEDYSRTHRGGQGVINIKTSDRNGKVMGIKSVNDNDQLMVVSTGGIMIRMNANGISCIGRNTQGVRIMRVDKGKKVASLGKIEDIE